MYMNMHQLFKQGFNISEIARKTGMSRTTIYKYLGKSPDEFSEWLASGQTRKRKLDPYKKLILSWLKEDPGKTSAQIFDWLQEKYPGIDVAESTVRLYVNKLREKYYIPKVKWQRDYEAVPDLPMGQQAQVDFGETKQKTSTGKKIKLYFISFVLSHSRFKVVLWIDRPFTTKDVIRAHEYAFQQFEGIPYELVYDQDSLMTVSENAGNIIHTKEFKSYIDQRKFEIYLCRRSDPETKGKIESVVKFIKGNFAKNRIFHTLELWNEQSGKWLERTGNWKVHNTTKKRPAEVYTLEKQHLRPISHVISIHPTDDMSITRTVRKDNTILYKSNRYSVPLGTYNSRNTVVYLTIVDEKQLIIKSQFDDEVLALHQIALGKGKLIQNRSHTRDRTQGIDAYITRVANLFENVEEAHEYLKHIRICYPRYIRDQLQIIYREVQKVDPIIMNQTLRFCLEERLYSATDFKDVLHHFIKEQAPITEIDKHEVKSLDYIDPFILKTKPETREITEYVSILKGEKV